MSTRGFLIEILLHKYIVKLTFITLYYSTNFKNICVGRNFYWFLVYFQTFVPIMSQF